MRIIKKLSKINYLNSKHKSRLAYTKNAISNKILKINKYVAESLKHKEQLKTQLELIELNLIQKNNIPKKQKTVLQLKRAKITNNMQCNKCFKVKILKEFYNNTTTSYTCKNCHKQDRKNHYINNKETVIKKQSEYIKNNLNARLAANLRSRLNSAVKRKTRKRGSAVLDLGCSIDELKQYLASKFQSGMTWDNYGEWHIDHIKPLSSFKLDRNKQFRKACHYTNLQPLWAADNLSKHNKVS